MVKRTKMKRSNFKNLTVFVLFYQQKLNRYLSQDFCTLRSTCVGHRILMLKETLKHHTNLFTKRRAHNSGD